MTDKTVDIAVIGGGPAGYTAALYGARAGYSVVVLEQMAAGGQMLKTDLIENYPGIEKTDGSALAEQMRQQAEAAGARTVFAAVEHCDLSASPKTVVTADGMLYAKAVILAMGAKPRRMGLDGENALEGRGISYCAACDGRFYKGKKVIVLGGGNTAFGDAEYLSKLADQVILIHRRDAFRAADAIVRRVRTLPNVSLMTPYVPVAFITEKTFIGDKLRGLVVQHTETGEKNTLECDGIFSAIGQVPVTDMIKDQLQLDKNGYIPAGEDCRTALPGVFAAGDIRTKQVRQIVTACADGAAAIQSAEAWLAEAEI